MRRFLVAALAVLTLATGAQAHSALDSSEPADAATVAVVDTIALRFKDALRVTSITMTGPDGEVALTREAGFDPATDFDGVPPADLPNGDYTVEWRGLSADGHAMQGTFGFTLAK
ncbi:copper resistance CopC family protein [Jannaschia pohangensis]|uniref:CopC domain-containing protein n=1 Tax=Jannaschia pohangensis TaxID=390807 RepID=A0A1I3R7U4_9RHOB|nr:copper resistance CopC family protein [Jannaschia pohangensis]SFJ41501.1 hypothetical protein SAMN04488095_2793 [Jannaschia pohangensis]